jgi:hypothetical protein
MKKLLLALVTVTLFTTTSFSQWVSKKIDNGFDTPYYIAYTQDGQNAYLKLENYKGIAFYMGGVYICDESVTVDISFMVNGEYQKYYLTGNVSENRKTLFMVDDLNSDPEFLADFKAASSVRIRVNDKTCDTEIYEFKMTGSTAAFNTVTNQK